MVDHPIAAYFLDRAVFTFGSALSGELEAIEGKDKKEIEGKRLRVIEKWLPKAVDATGKPAPAKARFADPASRSI